MPVTPPYNNHSAATILRTTSQSAQASLQDWEQGDCVKSHCCKQKQVHRAHSANKCANQQVYHSDTRDSFWQQQEVSTNPSTTARVISRQQGHYFSEREASVKAEHQIRIAAKSGHSSPPILEQIEDRDAESTVAGWVAEVIDALSNRNGAAQKSIPVVNYGAPSDGSNVSQQNSVEEDLFSVDSTLSVTSSQFDLAAEPLPIEKKSKTRLMSVQGGFDTFEIAPARRLPRQLRDLTKHHQQQRNPNVFDSLACDVRYTRYTKPQNLVERNAGKQESYVFERMTFEDDFFFAPVQDEHAYYLTPRHSLVDEPIGMRPFWHDRVQDDEALPSTNFLHEQQVAGEKQVVAVPPSILPPAPLAGLCFAGGKPVDIHRPSPTSKQSPVPDYQSRNSDFVDDDNDSMTLQPTRIPLQPFRNCFRCLFE